MNSFITDMNQSTKKNHITTILSYLILLLIFSTLAYFSYSYLYFCAAIVLWLLPTIVAVAIDSHPQRYLSFIVCIFNICGTLPYIVKLFRKSNIEKAVLKMLGHSNTWLMVYGAAAIGWIIYAIVPQIYLAITTMRMQIRLEKTRDKLFSLEQEWED